MVPFSMLSTLEYNVSRYASDVPSPTHKAYTRKASLMMFFDNRLV